MKPLRRGKVRTELRDQLVKLNYRTDLVDPAGTFAALLGGAIEETCKEMSIASPTFWRYTIENLWRLVRALEASGQLNKI